MNKQLIYQNKKIHYRIIGNGDPVILIHGFGEEGDIWNSQVEYLKNKFKLIIPDLPGSGLSEMIGDMGIDEMAEVIHAIIHEENIDSCSVIGHSMGGYISLALLEKYWNHISGLGLFHSTAFADTDEKKLTRKKAIAFIEQNGAYEFLKTAIPNLFAEASQKKFKPSINKLIEQGNNFSPDALVSYYNAMIERPDRSHLLQKTTIPVLFIMGKYDKAVPLEDGLKQCHLPEKSYIHILQNSGHMGMIEEKDLANEFLEEFLLDK